MGRRKIEIKAIKDDRNRSVTFLKRKGGLFKKAHELSVLCSVDVAVFIFGNNKKLYEYSSTDMHELISRYQYHGGPNEHKGPGDFSGGNDDDDDDDGEGTPPRGHDASEHQMMPPQFHAHPQAPFSHMRHHTPSASPPIPNGGPFQSHPAPSGHSGPRGTTPQPSVGSRPGSRNDIRRVGPNMVPQPHGAHPGISYMPAPPVYQPASAQPGVASQQPPARYSYSQPQPQLQPQSQSQPQQPSPPQAQAQPQTQPRAQPQAQVHQHQHQKPSQQTPHFDDRRLSVPPGYAPQPPPPPPSSAPVILRAEATLPQGSSQQQISTLHPAGQHISPPLHPDKRIQDHQPPPPFETKGELVDRPQRPYLNTDTTIKKLPQKKSHSIFTPIEENRSILSQHLASFASESQGIKSEPVAATGLNRSQSADFTGRGGSSTSPPLKRCSVTSGLDKNRTASVSSSAPESSFTSPSNSNSLKTGGPSGATRPRGPRLTVQIPDGASEPESAGPESKSSHGSAITPTQAPRHNSVVLPPPSPSASALVSAGATGPPNPFARPPPQQTVNGETPVSALPSRFLHNELLPSPSSFYPDWNFRGNDSNTLPSPLNFATPVVGTGPSFLRDDNHSSIGNHHSSASNNSNSSTTPTAATTGTTAAISGLGSGSGPPNLTKRKSPDFEAGHGENTHSGTSEAKRLKVEKI